MKWNPQFDKSHPRSFSYVFVFSKDPDQDGRRSGVYPGNIDRSVLSRFLFRKKHRFSHDWLCVWVVDPKSTERWQMSKWLCLPVKSTVWLYLDEALPSCIRCDTALKMLLLYIMWQPEGNFHSKINTTVSEWNMEGNTAWPAEGLTSMNPYIPLYTVSDHKRSMIWINPNRD